MFLMFFYRRKNFQLTENDFQDEIPKKDFKEVLPQEIFHI
jgi:hypothetical protein